MQSVYVVCEDLAKLPIPVPMDPLAPISDWNGSTMPKLGSDWNGSTLPKLGSDFFGHIPMKPRFDPISPNFTKKTMKTPKNNIVCICKDLETAKYYLNMSSDRYLLGPYNIV